MSVITVSRQFGSLGKEIAEKFAESLGYKFLDKAILESQYDKYGIPDVSFEKYDEKNPGFIEYFKSGKDRYLRYLKTVVFENSKEGDCVICGRGAHLMLQGIPGVLKVRIIASEEIRAARIAEQLECDMKNAERIINQYDKNRSGFHKFFFEQDWRDPEYYDIILNTDDLSIDSCVDTLLTMNKCECLQSDPQILKRKIEDKFIAQEVIISLMYEHSIPIDILDVTSVDGAVTIKGTVTVEQNIDQCVKAAMEVPGVKSVDPEIYFITNYMGY
ncbi:MAG: BON domain-containing protein [Calditrichaeota bacterium]|nr:MAG: BON domain-containing protein [Calditrichota bacterium]